MGGDRTYDQCRVRWNGVLKVFKNRGTVVKTGPWAKAEVYFIPFLYLFIINDLLLVRMKN